MSEYAREGVSVRAAGTLGEEARGRLHRFVEPLVEALDRGMDARLVRTLIGCLEAILAFRNRAMGLLLSELGAYLLGPEHAPAGTKRLSNLLRSVRWSGRAVEEFLLQVAERKLEELEAQGTDALLVWDGSVQEKVESRKAEGLCSVRSSKAARCLKRKPGFYQPPTHKPIFVPGLHWFALLLIGRSGPPMLAAMRWWSRRGERATTDRQVQTGLLVEIAKRWGRRVLHVLDREFCDGSWIGAMLGFHLRFVVRFRKGWGLVPLSASEAAEDAASAAPKRQAAWKIARGKRSRDKQMIWDARSRTARLQGVYFQPVEHPQWKGVPLWLVVSRPGKGRPPWYLLTNEPVHTAQDAWRIIFAYARRWQIEQCFRYNKSELSMESPRLWTWDRRIKLLLLVSVCYAFLLSLLDPLLRWLVAGLLRTGCHRTGKRSRETPAPLYRLRAAISRMFMSYPVPLPYSAIQNPG